MRRVRRSELWRRAMRRDRAADFGCSANVQVCRGRRLRGPLNRHPRAGHSPRPHGDSETPRPPWVSSPAHRPAACPERCRTKTSVLIRKPWTSSTWKRKHSDYRQRTARSSFRRSYTAWTQSPRRRVRLCGQRKRSAERLSSRLIRNWPGPQMMSFEGRESSLGEPLDPVSRAGGERAPRGHTILLGDLSRARTFVRQ